MNENVLDQDLFVRKTKSSQILGVVVDGHGLQNAHAWPNNFIIFRTVKDNDG